MLPSHREVCPATAFCLDVLPHLTTAQEPRTEAHANLSLSFLKFFVSDILT